MVYVQTESALENETHKTLIGFGDTNGSRNFYQKTRQNKQEKKNLSSIANFSVLLDHRLKIKESERINTCTLPENRKRKL